MMDLSTANLPKITILLATYNRAQLIGETLCSIQAQTYKNWECLIVDDNSEDETFAVVQKIIKEDNRFGYYLKTHGYKKGLSGTRNYGLDLAMEHKAQFIHFFDDDDIMHPKKLELQMVPFLKDDSLDLTICCYRKFENIATIEYDLAKANDGSCTIITKDLLRSFFLYNINLNSGGPLWNVKKIKDYRFNENLLYAEERDLYLRIFLNEEINYYPVPEILFWYRKHAQSITNKLNLYNKGQQSTQFSNNAFLDEVLNLRDAPFYILKSYSKSFKKNKKYEELNKIKNYLTCKWRWMSIKNLYLLIYIQISLNLLND